MDRVGSGFGLFYLKFFGGFLRGLGRVRSGGRDGGCDRLNRVFGTGYAWAGVP